MCSSLMWSSFCSDKSVEAGGLVPWMLGELKMNSIISGASQEYGVRGELCEDPQRPA